MLRTYNVFGVCIHILVILGLSPIDARAKNIVIMSDTYEVIGVRITKSASLRLANLHGNLSMSGRSTYVPAGSLLLITKKAVKDRTGRVRNLALTDMGILVYVTTRNYGHNPQYWKPDNLWLKDKQKIAIAQTNIPVQIEDGPPITITPSERFDFEYGDSDNLEIKLTKERIGQGYNSDASVSIDERYFSVVTADELQVDNFPGYFEPYNIVTELVQMLDGLRQNGFDENTKARVQELLSTRFINQKSCRQEITIPVNLDAEAGVGARALIADIYGKLKLSAAYQRETKYPRGLSFHIQRFKKENGNGSKYMVVEIQQETIQSEDCDLEQKQRVVAGVSTGEEGEINTQDVREYHKLRVTADGLPIYTCRDQYLKLQNDLTVHDNLPLSVSALLLSQFAIFEDAKNPAVCKS